MDQLIKSIHYENIATFLQISHIFDENLDYINWKTSSSPLVMNEIIGLYIMSRDS